MMPTPTIKCPYCNNVITRVRYMCSCVEGGTVGIKANPSGMVSQDWDYLDVDSHDDHDNYTFMCPICDHSVRMINLIVPIETAMMQSAHMTATEIINRTGSAFTTPTQKNGDGIWHCQ